jgi:hypothetical protein
MEASARFALNVRNGPFLPAFLVPRDQTMKTTSHLVPTPSSMVHHRLPSLEVILKRMNENTPHHDMAFPLKSNLKRTPVGRMPSLSTLISPNISKNAAFYSPRRPSIQGRVVYAASPAMKYDNSQASMPHKRNWDDFSSTTTAAAQPQAKERVMSPTTLQRGRASKYCKVEGCERVAQRNNLCHSHGGKRLCKEEGCSSKDRGNGFCIKHGGGKICSMNDCEKKARRKGLCTQHFRAIENDQT